MFRKAPVCFLLCFGSVSLIQAHKLDWVEEWPKTRAEATNFAQTSSYADVIAFLDALKAHNPPMKFTFIGKSPLGKDMPLVIVAKNPEITPQQAKLEGKLVVYIQANIHAGEVEGKESCLMLARDVTTGPLARLVEKAVVLLVPDYNPDGNDRIDKKNRALDLAHLDGQVGPEGGVGTRTTGEGLNLNRDYMKQAGTETRRLAALVAAWMPHVTVDCHTTDGSVHGYELTFDTSRNLASCPPGPAVYARDRLLRDV